MNDRKEILILGIGNLLLRDEGVGVHVVEQLKKMHLSPLVDVLDGGTAGHDLLFYIEGRKKVIVIDAVKAGGSPGAIYRFTEKDLEEKRGISFSVHQIDLIDVIRTSRFMGRLPEIVFIGVETQEISAGLELSPEIERIIPKILDLVIK
jgi:hydrogenase maturation protease